MVVGKFNIVGWTGHWFLTDKTGERILNENGKRFWFTKKSAAETRARELSK